MLNSHAPPLPVLPGRLSRRLSRSRRAKHTVLTQAFSSSSSSSSSSNRVSLPWLGRSEGRPATLNLLRPPPRVGREHRLPEARQRTNVVTNDYTPRGRLFGGYTTRGEEVTIASYRFPQSFLPFMPLRLPDPQGLPRNHTWPLNSMPLCLYLFTRIRTTTALPGLSPLGIFLLTDYGLSHLSALIRPQFPRNAVLQELCGE